MKSLDYILNTPRKLLGKSQLLRRQRYRFWEKNPKCFYCGKITRFIEQSGGSQEDDYATIEHLKSRLNPDRGSTKRNRVLSCYQCNQSRAREEDSKLSIEEKWKRSGRKPQNYGNDKI